MARNRRRSGVRRRGPPRTANGTLLPRSYIPLSQRWDEFDNDWLEQVSKRSRWGVLDLTRWEDRRRWHPDRLGQVPVDLKRSRPRIVVVSPHSRFKASYGEKYKYGDVLRMSRLESNVARRFESLRSGVPHGIGFDVPHNVIICVRRKRRKEVMHALGKAGAGGMRKPRRNEWSDVRC